MSEYVNTPGGHDDPSRLQLLIDMSEAGIPVNENMFIPTDEQVRLILWWYAVDESGQYLYREGVIRRLKGWGKDPFAAAMALAELCGPVAFSYFDSDGEPVGKPRNAAWITVAAVSQDQTKNTFSLFPVMISKKLKGDYGLDVNRFIIYSGAGGRIEAATSSPASMEGNRPTFVIQNETQWWGQGPDGKVNEGHSMASVIEGNMTKVDGSRTLSICNAHVPGTETVAEKAYIEWQNVQSGTSVDAGMMYDALEAPADTPISEIPSEREDPVGFAEGLEKLREGLLVARGDSTWLPVDDIIKSILSTKNVITESRRKFLNQVNAAEDSWLSPQEWDRIATVSPEAALQPKQKITLGFDGSKSNDWTALVACRVEDGMLFLIKAWDPAKHGGEVPREDVDATVRSCFERFDVVAFRADVKEFEAYVDQWSRMFKKRLKVNASPNNPVAFDMRGQQKRFAFDCERLEDAVIEREVSHDGNPTLRQHVLNAKRHPTNYDAIAIRKATKDSSKKIDAAVCAVLAFGARQDYLMSKKARSGRVVAVR
jgi:phage terminase large subunit-like protein